MHDMDPTAPDFVAEGASEYAQRAAERQGQRMVNHTTYIVFDQRKDRRNNTSRRVHFARPMEARPSTEARFGAESFLD